MLLSPQKMRLSIQEQINNLLLITSHIQIQLQLRVRQEFWVKDQHSKVLVVLRHKSQSVSTKMIKP